LLNSTLRGCLGLEYFSLLLENIVVSVIFFYNIVFGNIFKNCVCKTVVLAILQFSHGIGNLGHCGKK
jgi:hypothetical protein